LRLTAIRQVRCGYRTRSGPIRREFEGGSHQETYVGRVGGGRPPPKAEVLSGALLVVPATVWVQNVRHAHVPPVHIMNLDPFVERRKRATPKHPEITTAARTKLACFPATVLAFVVDHQDRPLLLRRKGQPGWEAPGGPLQAGESVPEAAERILREMGGPSFLGVYLAVLDTFTFVFDANLPAAITICVLLRHRGGELRPGKAVRDAEFMWWPIPDIDQLDLAVPRARWDLLTKAADMGRTLRDARPDDFGRLEDLDDRWSPGDDERWR